MPVFAYARFARSTADWISDAIPGAAAAVWFEYTTIRSTVLPLSAAAWRSAAVDLPWVSLSSRGAGSDSTSLGWSGGKAAPLTSCSQWPAVPCERIRYCVALPRSGSSMISAERCPPT